MENVIERLENINPCLDCSKKECGLIDGQECQKHKHYLLIKKDIENMKNELEFTRCYIHDNGLEWDLLSKYKRSEVGKSK